MPSAKPQDPPGPPKEAVSEAPTPEAETGASSSGRYEYVSGFGTVYPHVPLTVKAGDVWAWPDGPPDKRWVETDKPVNTRPDNEPAEPTEG